MQKPHSFQQIPGPSLLNAAKRHGSNCDVDDGRETRDQFQHFRKSDISPPPDFYGRNTASLPSLHYVNIEGNEISSKSLKQSGGQTSSKEIFPPSIQRYLSGGSQISMKEAVDKLKTPSKKAHDKNLEHMKFLTFVQQQEIHNHLASRRAGSNSVTSVSPTYAGSPLSSPLMYTSPKAGPASSLPEENIIMTYDDEDAMINFSQNLNSEMAFDHMNGGNQQMNMWKTNMVSQSETQAPNAQSPYNFGQQQAFLNGQFQHQMDQNSQAVQQEVFNPFAQINQEMQFNPSQQVNQLNVGPFYNGQSQSNTNISNQETQDDSEGMPIEETRERSNSFLRKLSLPQNRPNLSPIQMAGNSPNDCKSLVANQISVIQSLMESKRSISPVDQNRGLMQYFQKRNSNPENPVGSPMLMIQQQQQQQQQQMAFQIQPQQVQRSQQSIASNLLGNYNGQNHMDIQQQQQQQQAYFMFHNHQQSQQQNFLAQMNANHHGGMGQHPQFNSHELEQRLYAEQGSYMSGTNSGKNSQEMNKYLSENTRGGISTTNTSEQANFDAFGYSYNSEMNQEWNQCSSNSHGRAHDNEPGILGPEAFLNNDTEDFDMNIVQSEVNFIPQRYQPIGMGESVEDQFFVPESGGVDSFFDQSHGRYNFDI